MFLLVIQWAAVSRRLCLIKVAVHLAGPLDIWTTDEKFELTILPFVTFNSESLGLLQESVSEISTQKKTEKFMENLLTKK